jgi:putative nucleotidyltransferase with HDIG domain
MINENIKPYVEKITKLPTIPVVAQEILSLADNDLLSVTKLEKIIQNDPAISAKVLSVANSAYFGINSTTSTLNNAILRIGFNNVKSIALAVSLITVMGDNSGKTLDYQRIFNHSVSVGYVARMLAKETSVRIADEVMIDGLLHDIGFLVLNQYFSDIYQTVIDRLDEEPLIEAEKNIFGFSHSDIGTWLADKWNLPANVMDSIAYHHSPSIAKKNNKRIAIIHIADYTATKCILGPTRKDPGYILDHSSLELLNMTEESLNNFEATISYNPPEE